MTYPFSYPIYPITEVAAQIDQGKDPWFALGGFHDWWCDAKDRQDLITEPPAHLTTAEGKRWSAVSAAVVEEFCLRTGFPGPVDCYRFLDWRDMPLLFYLHSLRV